MKKKALVTTAGLAIVAMAAFVLHGCDDGTPGVETVEVRNNPPNPDLRAPAPPSMSGGGATAQEKKNP